MTHSQLKVHIITIILEVLIQKLWFSSHDVVAANEWYSMKSSNTYKILIRIYLLYLIRLFPFVPLNLAVHCHKLFQLLIAFVSWYVADSNIWKQTGSYDDFTYKRES